MDITNLPDVQLILLVPLVRFLKIVEIWRQLLVCTREKNKVAH